MFKEGSFNCIYIYTVSLLKIHYIIISDLDSYHMGPFQQQATDPFFASLPAVCDKFDHVCFIMSLCVSSWEKWSPFTYKWGKVIDEPCAPTNDCVSVGERVSECMTVTVSSVFHIHLDSYLIHKDLTYLEHVTLTYLVPSISTNFTR